MKRNIRPTIISSFAVFAILCTYLVLTQIKFSFDFQDFFPHGDEDYEFFLEFQENFEADDNFLLLAVESEPDIFDSTFLAKFHELTLRADTLLGVQGAQSLTTLKYPILKPPFFAMSVPVLHKDDPSRYAQDKEDILQDPRLVNNLISKDGKAVVLLIKNENQIPQDTANMLVTQLNEMVQSYDFKDYHLLGRANFMKELVEMQVRELTVSIIISVILTAIILSLLFQRMIGVTIAMTSIGLSLLFFAGVMSLFGRQFSALSALYPVMMSIVATSDVVHFLTKYVDELRHGKTKEAAIRVTIKDIGLATLLTSLTTAVGFLSLMTSKTPAIYDFGINAAAGVIIAYVTVLLLTSALLSYFDEDQIIKQGRGQAFWEGFMTWFYQYTKDNPKRIALVGSAFAAICLFGASMITTNYRLEANLPLNRKITADYLYFEEELVGFRPLEMAVSIHGDHEADDYEVMKEMLKIEEKMASYKDIEKVNSITTLYKTLNRAHNGNRVDEYKFPETKARFIKYQRSLKNLPPQTLDVLVSKDKKYARITSSVLDIGADNIKRISDELDVFINENIDSTIITAQQTGTSLMLDKNAEYIRKDLIYGLAVAVILIGVLMAVLFQNWRMVLISLVPNVFPLLVGAALLGYFNIELETSVSIIFAIIFGIAVDDTIHFLSKYKIARSEGNSLEEAMRITFVETGKAICLTTIILFFGFLVLLFSIHPPSITVGILISVTLVSALIGDLFLIPVLIRTFLDD